LQVKYIIRLTALLLLLVTLTSGSGDGLTIILCLWFFIINVLSTFIRSNRYKGLYYFFTITNLLFIGLGILFYEITPGIILNNRTMFYINLSYMAFLFGMLLGEKMTIPVRRFTLIKKNSLNKRISLPYNIIIVVLIGITINTVSYLFPNFISSLGIGPKVKFFINMIFNYEFYFLILFLLIFNDYKLYKQYEKLIILLFFVTFVLAKLLIGVKSGIIQILIFLIIVFFTMSKDFIISKKVIFSCLFIFPLILLSYSLGLSIRYLVLSKYFVGNIGLIEMYITIYDNLSLSDLDVIGIMTSFFERVSVINQIDILINSETNIAKWATNYFQYLVNLLLPSSIFPNAQPPAVYFNVAYLNKSLSDSLTNYHSHMLPIYGELYSLIGSFSLIIIFFIGLFYIKIINFLFKQNFFSDVAVYAFSMHTIYFLLIGMGFVAAIQHTMYSIIIPGIIFVIFFSKTFLLLKNTYSSHQFG